MKKRICISVIMAAALLLAACEPESGETSSLGSSDVPVSSGPAEIPSEPPETSSRLSDTSSGGAEELSPGDRVPVDEIRFGDYEVHPDGTLVVYDNETEYVMKYDPEAKEFIALAEVPCPDDDELSIWDPIPEHICVSTDNENLYINMLTGETTGNRADLFEGVPEDIGKRLDWVDENVFFLPSNSFSVEEYGNLTVYTFDVEPDEGGRLTGHDYNKPVEWRDYGFTDVTIVADRYFAGLYEVNEYIEEEGMGDVYYPYLVVYDYETNEFADVIAFDPEDCNPFANSAHIYYAGGSRVLLTDDYDILVDVVKLAGGVYEPVPLLGTDTFRYVRETGTWYSCDRKNVYAYPPDGESAVLYTWTADDGDICDFAVTENGTVAVVVMETYNRSLYVDGELLREDVFGIVYADDESILATLGDGRLELIPMP